MQKNLKNKAGETLIEVLVALTLIMMSGTAATMSMISALQGSGLSHDYLIAQNLASEGIELVKNLRDTNWMEYPSNRTKWMEGLSETGEYRVYMDGDKWKFEKPFGAFFLANYYDLCLVDDIYQRCFINGTISSKFSRKIIVENLTDDYIDFDVEVKFGDTNVQTFTDSYRLTNYL